MILIAISDAARNCRDYGAVATVTLRSGVQLVGRLEAGPAHLDTTAHLKQNDGGWSTFLLEEVAAVSVTPRR
ncbi:MAG TPA: hypothetical protein VF678_02715 [bacterium]